MSWSDWEIWVIAFKNLGPQDSCWLFLSIFLSSINMYFPKAPNLETALSSVCMCVWVLHSFSVKIMLIYIGRHSKVVLSFLLLCFTHWLLLLLLLLLLQMLDSFWKLQTSSSLLSRLQNLDSPCFHFSGSLLLTAMTTSFISVNIAHPKTSWTPFSSLCFPAMERTWSYMDSFFCHIWCYHNSLLLAFSL